MKSLTLRLEEELSKNSRLCWNGDIDMENLRKYLEEIILLKRFGYDVKSHFDLANSYLSMIDNQQYKELISNLKARFR